MVVFKAQTPRACRGNGYASSSGSRILSTIDDLRRQATSIAMIEDVTLT